MSTYCRITGKSRGLPKPNYFPLLPPISPADAKRFCRITGKAYGLPSHHYIPVLVGKPRSNSKNKTKSSSDKPHVVVAGYRYFFPCLDDSPPHLIELLDAKNDSLTQNAQYVYTVKERNCGLVFSAKLEAAVRDGDVRDVMLAKDADTVLLKLKKGGNVSLEVKEINLENAQHLYDGQGVATVTPRKKTASATDAMKKLFEGKELAAENETVVPPLKKARKTEVRNWKNVECATTISTEQPSFDIWDFSECKENTDEKNAVEMSNVVNVSPKPIAMKPMNIDLSTSKPGIIQTPHVSEEYVRLPVAQVIAPFKPLDVNVEPSLVESILSLSPQKLDNTWNVEHIVSDQLEILPQLSDISDVAELVQTSGEVKVLEKDGLELHGVEITKDGRKIFIIGQHVQTSNGLQFICGKTVQTTSGLTFVPGVVTNTDLGPKLFPGLTVTVNGKNEFVVGQITLTSKGEQFVAGQILQTNEGLKFQPGQTIITEEGMKFIPGQIVENRFVPGQTIVTRDGPQFVPGQTVDTGEESLLVPGQSLWTEKGWEFVPGITVDAGEERKFVPGKYVKTDKNNNTTTFIPGQSVVDENGCEVFIPGVTVEEDGLKFVNGMSIQTPEGDFKFVQGQVVNVEGAMKFLPGTIITTTEGEPKFSAISNLNDLPYMNTQSLYTSISNTAEAHSPNYNTCDGVFGHIIQSNHGVEFFPGPSTCLPKGKAVPGKLVRGAEIKFVPGLMVEGVFVPGQVVMTERGEQFVPGQVIETQEGPKFVPGKIIKTECGEKFVPGQTVETEEGLKFVPGQIVETKAGPTFIPGQVIYTDEGGSKFVPGQVVDTIEGPRFVPGRVVETGDHVTFIPGQVVETSEGLRFVAPDLTGENENTEFTVQGFDIAPEELKLIQPIFTGTNSLVGNQMSIDSKMLRQLSEAGMAIGHQVNSEVPMVNVKTAPAMNVACALGHKLKLDPVTTVKLSEIIAAVVQIGKLGEVCGSTEEIHTLNEILERVVHCKNDDEAYRLISNIIEKEMKENILQNVDKIHSYLLSQESPLRRVSKVNLFKEIINCNISDTELLKKLAVVLNDEDETVGSALQHLSQVKPEILNQIVQRFTDTVGRLESEKEATETLHRAVVATVIESSEQSIVDLLKDAENLDLKTLILEAVGLAKALDMQDTATALLAILSNPKCTNILAGDRLCLEILRRLTVMRQLAQKRPELLEALKVLHVNPYEARNDPALKQLARESAALLVIPEEGIESSKVIPSSLMLSRNSLAMEEFLYRTKRVFHILVIIKNELQAIIPREASHSVLTGSVPYVVLDEKGLHHFQPKHVFSALSLPKIAINWFSSYKCEYKDVVTN